MSSGQSLWTIQVTGASPFTFQVAGNPAVEHAGGGVTVAHLVLSQPEVGEVKLMAAQAGCVARAWPMEGQSEVQAEQRARFMALGEPGGEPLWAHPACQTCPWFDPMAGEGEVLDGNPAHRGVNPCGLKHLPEESITVLRETSEAYAKAERECPVED